MSIEISAFKAKSHILSLLGDELIGSDILAIFELVKNSYDACANEVTILLQDLNTDDQKIIVEDDGCGMTPHDLQNVWLEIGTDFKRGSKRKIRCNRIPLGEKGVGRLAVHKLGKHILLETQAEGSLFSNRIEIDWQKLIDEANYIDDTRVEIEMVPSNLLPKGKGTRISISRLKKRKWTKRDLRELARKINSIKSPFKTISDFDVKIIANDHHQDWFEDIKDVDEILESSLYYFDFNVKPSSKGEFAEYTWNYRFTAPKSFKITPETKSNREDKLLLIDSKDEENPFGVKRLHLTNEDLDGIGTITAKFYVYNLLSQVLKPFGQPNAIKKYVKENCGVKVFRDGIRVYNYGEPADDWLGLDLSLIHI